MFSGHCTVAVGTAKAKIDFNGRGFHLRRHDARCLSMFAISPANHQATRPRRFGGGWNNVADILFAVSADFPILGWMLGVSVVLIFGSDCSKEDGGEERAYFGRCCRDDRC